MVPSGAASRQVLIWSVPTLVILLSLVWYRRKRNTLRTDPGGTSDSATKAKADKETNGHVHPTDNTLPKQEDLPDKVLVKEAEKQCVVKEELPKEVKKPCVEQGAIPKPGVVQEAGPKPGVVQEEKVVVDKAVPKEEKKSCVQEAGVVQEEKQAEEQVVVKKVAPKEEKKPPVRQEAVSKPGVVQEKKKVEEQLVVKKAVPKEAVEPVAVKEAVPKEEKKPCVQEAVPEPGAVQEEKVEEVPVVEEAVVVKKAVLVVGEKGSPPEEKPGAVQEEKKVEAMSKEDVASEGGAAAAVVLQEEKVGSLGGKLASLSLEEQRCVADADRDSANHSPVDAMLASPSLSNYSDEHSEGSSDSGKGCSDVASPPSRTPLGGSSLAGDAENDADVRYAVYEFLLPQNLVGRLIGPRGSFVQEIKSKTNATVQVKKHPELLKQKICVVDGMQSEVDAALAMIRERYPIRKFPTVTLEQVAILSNVQPTCALIPEYCQLHLVEGVNNEVMVSCMVSPGHMFLQQPYHPTFQYLTRLSEAMNSVYSHADAPHVPEPITVGSICVAPATEGWYRVQVVSIDDESHSCEVKFVDHGGYMTISNSSLRQIHHDFMSVPFQATECFLANIKPPGGSNVWSDEAVRLVDKLTRGQMLYAQVYDYTEYSIPLVYLYCCVNSLVVLINQELVARGLAELDDVASAESVAATEAAALVAAAAEVAPLTRPATETPSEVEAV